MSITEALSRAHALLQECSIPMREADKVGEALRLLAASISALQTPNDKKEASE